MRIPIICILSLCISYTASSQKQAKVYFDFDKADLSTLAIRTLDSIATDRRLVSLEVYGHCDQLGSRQYNYRLSVRRANAVRDYLLVKGVAPDRIKVIKGFGEDQPAINLLDEESRQANRRVTIIGIYQPVSVDTPTIKTAPVVPNVTKASPPVKRQRKEKLVDEITDTATKAGQNIVLKNINFYGGSHRFLPMAYEPLQELLEVMQQIPTLVIEIHGHICCVEDEGDGMDNDTGEPFLSFNRAKAVYFFLLKNGIEKSRMSYKGFGHKYPIFPTEKNDEERTANRRVEIKIVRK